MSEIKWNEKKAKLILEKLNKVFREEVKTYEDIYPFLDALGRLMVDKMGHCPKRDWIENGFNALRDDALILHDYVFTKH
jgi:hypothetical protein